MIPLRDINPTEGRPWLVYVLIAMNVVVFLYQVSLPVDAGKELIYRYGMVPYYLTEEFRPGSLSTPLTSMFMHGGWMHLISNMWFLFVFGDNVEDRLGSVRFILFYLLCGLLAAVAQMVVDPASRIPMVGASGAIAGVLAAYFKLFPNARVITLIPVLFIMLVRELPAVFFIVVWFVLQLVSGIGSLGYVGSRGGVAFFAHIGGFLAGLLLLRLFAGQISRRGGRGARRGRYRVGPGPRGRLH